MLEDLWDHGVRKLMVEGGGTVHTQFLQADRVDEIQLAVAPFFLGDPAAPRFANSSTYPTTGAAYATGGGTDRGSCRRPPVHPVTRDLTDEAVWPS